MGASPTAERPLIRRNRIEPLPLRRSRRPRAERRIQWETVFFGLLAGIGLAAVLVAMYLGALVAAGVSDFGQDAASVFRHLVVAGGAISIAILALSYLTGGYVAARMARFDGWRQGLGLWLLSLLLVLAVAVAGWVGGGTLDPTRSISLPADPIDAGPLSPSWWAIAAAAALVPLVFAVAGGVLGERYHRAVDRATVELELPGEEIPEAETEAIHDYDDRASYGPDRLRQEAPASAASESAEETGSPEASPNVSAAANESPQP